MGAGPTIGQSQVSNTLYGMDFAAWIEQQAELLRAGDVAALDLENLAEEIEGLGNNERRELASRIEVLLMHLLKWKIQVDHRSRSWRSTILEQRSRIELVIEDSPSLRRQVPSAIAKRYALARRRAIDDTGLLRDCFPDECPFTAGQVLDPDFLPE